MIPRLKQQYKDGIMQEKLARDEQLKVRAQRVVDNMMAEKAGRELFNTTLYEERMIEEGSQILSKKDAEAVKDNLKADAVRNAMLELIKEDVKSQFSEEEITKIAREELEKLGYEFKGKKKRRK